MKLTKREDCILEMLKGCTVVDADGREWFFKADTFYCNNVSCSVNWLALPATVKQEPELLYEVAMLSAGEWEISDYLRSDKETESANNLFFKTGRVFEVVDGSLRLRSEG